MNPTALPFAALNGFSTLYQTYCTDYSRLADFYAGDFRQDAVLQNHAATVAAHPRDRETLADVLLDQNQVWGMNAATRRQIEALRNPESVAVVTGQQVGLFGGPLYTIYKTITALQWADRLAAQTGRPVVPVFWLEGEDHDLEEMAHMAIFRHGQPETITYTGHTLPETGNLGPIGRLILTDQIHAALDQLAEGLPPTDFHGAVMTAVRTAYTPGTSLRDAFAHLMRALFPEEGLVFISSDDVHLKRLAQPLFAKEIEGYNESFSRLQTVSETLAEDFHAQVYPRATNLFLIEPDGRYGLEPSEDGFHVRGTDRHYTKAELQDLLASNPERFSANVVLRPLLQDKLLPTVAYIAGPGEVAYFAQFKPLYAWAEIPMPIIVPRASVTMVERGTDKVLDRYDLPIEALGQDPDALFRAVVLAQMDVDVEAAFATAQTSLAELFDTLKTPIAQVDPTLENTAAATATNLGNQLEKLKQRVIKAEKRKDDQVQSQLERAITAMYPAGKLQERLISPLYFLNKYGFGLVQDWRENVSLETTTHQIFRPHG